MRTPVARRALSLAALLLMVSAGAAQAGVWYYEWSCTGRCAPGQLAVSGREGPFMSRADCEYARDHDQRADEFVADGNLGGLAFCEEDTSQPTGVYLSPGPGSGAPPNKTRISAVEIGVALGTSWRATGEDGMTTTGPGTVGLEFDSHAGRDVGGGSLQVGLYGTWLENPLLGSGSRSALIIPMSVGLVLTPQVYHHGSRSARLDLGASLGGFFLLGCSGCAGAVFDETLAFGYTLKAGVDYFVAKDTGFGVDVIVPSWQIGAAGPGNLLLESPTWMLRLSIINRPAQQP